MKKAAKQHLSQYEKMTQTPVSRLVFTLSIPTIISMLVTNIYNLVDTAFVGRLGTSASGAVGVVFGFMSIIQAFGFMLGQGSGSILSRALGQKDQETANKNAATGFYASILFGLLISAVGFIWLDEIVMLLGSTPTIAPYARTYIIFILLSSPFMCSSLMLNNVLRYEGHATLGTIGLMTGAVLNMIGDPILMFGCGLGIAGAGLSTAISQVISWIILVAMFATGKTQTRISIKNTAFTEPRVLLNIMATGFPSLLRQGLTSINTMMLNLQCAPYGDAAVAAMSIVSRVIFFSFSLAIGIGQGFQPVSGFNYGSKHYGRLRQAYLFTIKLSEIVIVVASIIIVIFSEWLIQIFRDDPQVISIGARALRLQGLAQLVLPPCVATEMLLQSTGHRLGATILSALRSGLLFIPALLILSNLRGLAGIQEAQPLVYLISLPITIPFAFHFFRSLDMENSNG